MTDTDAKAVGLVVRCLSCGLTAEEFCWIMGYKLSGKTALVRICMKCKTERFHYYARYD